MNQNDKIVLEYLKITSGFSPNLYKGPEEQGKQLVRCSVLKSINVEYSNVAKGNTVLKEK